MNSTLLMGAADRATPAFPKQPNWPRVLCFFLYVAIGVVGLPALTLSLVEARYGALGTASEDAGAAAAPASGLWTVRNHAFGHARDLLAADREVVDLRSVLPDALAAAAAINKDGSLVAVATMESREAADRAAATLAALYHLPSAEPTRNSVDTADGMEALLARRDTRVFVALAPDADSLGRRIDAVPGFDEPAGRAAPTPAPAVARTAPPAVLWASFGG